MVDVYSLSHQGIFEAAMYIEIPRVHRWTHLIISAWHTAFSLFRKKFLYFWCNTFTYLDFFGSCKMSIYLSILIGMAFFRDLHKFPAFGILVLYIKEST